jgi:hypothetical protein
MGIKRDGKGRRSKARRRGISIESLERRALLATTETFVAPSLTSLITQAEHGKNTSQAGINLMVDALQSQLQSGPLADLNSGAVTNNGFITEVQSLEASFESNVDLQLSPKFPNIDILLKLQGQRVVSDLIALNQQETVGLITNPELSAQAQSTIGSLSAGPILALGTKSSTITNTTKAFTTELNALSSALGSSTLSLAQVNTTLGAESESYRNDVHAGIQMTQLRISGEADTDINALQASVINIAQTNPSDAQTQLTTAITTFDNEVLGKTGLFAPHGALSKSKPAKLRSGTTNGQAPSTFSEVSGTTAIDGTATLTATLTSEDGSPQMGQTVGFTLDGAFAGIAITNFTGVATLAGIPTTATVGTDVGGIVAYFASNTNFLSTTGTGDLAVTKEATVVPGVSGSATFGGTATLLAALTTANGQVLPNETISFSLNGTAVGTAITNSSGIAILSGVPSTSSAGTITGAITASFAGDATNAASANTGNFVVAQAGTTFSSVGGTAFFGGKATLSATLLSTVTGQGAAGQTVNFVLDNTIVGTAVTDANGLATLTGVATDQGAGTDTGGVIVTFGGSTNFTATANATGDLVVSQAGTTVTSVAGTAQFGGTATLTATVTSVVTGLVIPAATVTFTLDGVAVGSAVTSSSGIATLSGVATSAPIGTDAGAVVASFAGIGSFAGSAGDGNLVVSPAATTLTNVSGTSSFGGTATLVATLDSASTNLPLSGQTVSFTLSGTAVGTAVTNSSGVATLSDVLATDAAGTIPGAVVATFAPSGNNAGSTGTGSLVISKASTALSGVAGSAAFGGTATLTATLKSTVTGLGIQSEQVQFTLNGVSVGSALTNSSGVATLTGVATSAGVGTDTGAVGATFGGEANYFAAPDATGDLVVTQAATSTTQVSGTAQFGGTATLTATLTNTTSGLPVANQTVVFTLNGTNAGSAMTNSSGIATVTGVATTAGVGVETGVVGASFAGDTDLASSSGTGDLTVAQASTSITETFGTADFGGTATLSATLMSTVTNQPIPNETVAFTLNGVSAGTAMTNNFGIATVSGVATSAGVGVETGVVGASFAGDTNFVSSSGTGDLTVVQAPTTLSLTSGSAEFGGTATLTTTLTSNVTNQPLANETVEFTLNGVDVGPAVTNNLGIATLTGVANSSGVGTFPGVIGVTFAGDTNFENSTGTGDLTVNVAPTSLTQVSGTAQFGGTATLTATLISTVTNQPLANETVEFTLNGVDVGPAVTNNLGVATLPGVANSSGVGTFPGVVGVTFAGDTNFENSTGTGDLTVVPAPTSLTQVSGSSMFGGTATLTATLISSVTNQPIANELIDLTLNGVDAGTVMTNSLGVATISGVADSSAVGTYPGVVGASFAGDSNFTASSGTGDFTVAQAATSVTNVSGFGSVGGQAVYAATLLSSVTNLGIPNETVSFFEDGNFVGSTTTDVNGLANLLIPNNTIPVGTYLLVAQFAGDTSFQLSQGSGTLTIDA